MDFHQAKDLTSQSKLLSDSQSSTNIEDDYFEELEELYPTFFGSSPPNLLPLVQSQSLKATRSDQNMAFPAYEGNSFDNGIQQNLRPSATKNSFDCTELSDDSFRSYQPDIPPSSVLCHDPQHLPPQLYPVKSFYVNISLSLPSMSQFHGSGISDPLRRSPNRKLAASNFRNFQDDTMPPVPYKVQSNIPLTHLGSCYNLSEEYRLQEGFQSIRHCMETGSEINKTNIVKQRHWSREENRLLQIWVERLGQKNWSQIAEMIPGRTGKQCRDRWNNHEKPNINKGTWSDDEERILIQAHKEMGNKWADIAERLPGRTENTIKNYWHATKRRKLQNPSKHPKHSTILQNYIHTLEGNSSTEPDADYHHI